MIKEQSREAHQINKLAGIYSLHRTLVINALTEATDEWRSRREIAALARVENSTMSALVQPLIAQNVLIEAPEAQPCTITGRRVVKLKLNRMGVPA